MTLYSCILFIVKLNIIHFKEFNDLIGIQEKGKVSLVKIKGRFYCYLINFTTHMKLP